MAYVQWQLCPITDVWNNNKKNETIRITMVKQLTFQLYEGMEFMFCAPFCAVAKFR
jgi:hypothetical protein